MRQHFQRCRVDAEFSLDLSLLQHQPMTLVIEQTVLAQFFDILALGAWQLIQRLAVKVAEHQIELPAAGKVLESQLHEVLAFVRF